MDDGQKRLRNGLPAGTVLNGVYRIEAEVGHGGFGIVYRAEHRVLGPVAIKEYLPADLAVREGGSVHPRSSHERAWYEDGLRGFQSEARKLVKFQNHPNVVTCRDYFEERGTAYLVMDYEEGLSLAELLAVREEEGRLLGEDELLALLEPLLDGLSVVHEAGVLHRDIKPANVLVRRKNEQPVLIDFGAAKQVVAEHSQSVAAYTEGYAAMEQVGAGRLGPWTDLYGVGATMWRIVAGGSSPWEDPRWANTDWRPPNPLKVELRMQALVLARQDPLPTARELGTGRYSHRVLDAIDRCLELKEEDRPAGCSELRRLLYGQIQEDSAAPRTYVKTAKTFDEAESAPESVVVSSAVGQQPRMALLGVAAVFLVLVVGGLVWLVGNREADNGVSPDLEVETTKDDLARVEPRLEQVPYGSLTLDLEPPDASVTLPDAGLDYQKGVQLPEGAHRVVVRSAGYRDTVHTVNVSGQTRVRIILEPELSAGDLRVFDGMQFVWIPVGEFVMGSESEHADDDEQPLTRVRISNGYWLGKYEVTQEQWQEVVGSNPSDLSNCGSDCPVENVSWDDVQEFIGRLNEQARTRKYRLPTEAEWEYAARAGTRGDTPTGNLRILGEHNAPQLDGLAWYGGNSGVSYEGGYDCSDWAGRQYSMTRCGTHPVGRKSPNGWGLHDMLGNVWEWVADRYGDYPGGLVTDPTGSSTGLDRVLRGGSWFNDASSCRASQRLYDSPSVRIGALGFRLARTK